MNNCIKVFVASFLIMGELAGLGVGYYYMGVADNFLNYVGAAIIIGASAFTYYLLYVLFVKPKMKTHA